MVLGADDGWRALHEGAGLYVDSSCANRMMGSMQHSLVLIPGLNMTAEAFDPVLAALPENIHGRVLDNPALTSIGSFRAREISGDVTLRNNAKLTTLGTLSSLENITGSLTIDNNAALTTIGMFTTSMRFVTTMMTISNNPLLTNLGQLSHLQVIGGVTVTSNKALPFCAAQEINHCVPNHGTVSITNNNNATMTCTCWCE